MAAAVAVAAAVAAVAAVAVAAAVAAAIHPHLRCPATHHHKTQGTKPEAQNPAGKPPRHPHLSSFCQRIELVFCQVQRG
jgi:hypothetical protein